MDWGSVELEPEVRDWLEALSTSRFATAAFYIDLLAEQGVQLKEPYTRQLDGKLRELRFHIDGQAVRITYWIASGRRIVLLTTLPGCVRPARLIVHDGRWPGASPLITRLKETTMTSRTSWEELRDRRMAEPGATAAYHATALAYRLGKTVRELRQQRGWSQTRLATEAQMTQSAIARFEAGGTIPSLAVLDRIAVALDADLTVDVTAREHVA